MQIKKIMKWLPVALSLLGALGYTGYDSELVRTGIAVLNELGVEEGAGRYETPARRRASAKSGHRYTGTVSKVYDGDTLHVIDGDGAKHKIRMAYIDAPEMKQAYGTRSRDNLRAAAEGRKVSVRVFDTDRYQREVAQVSVGKTDLNLMQVQDGAAWHYKSYAKEQQDKADFADYADAQIQAERERKGLWKAKNPQAPWAYRRAGRNGGGNKDWTGAVGEWLGIW
ncbi:thermonuclease family protein [Neisseria polysaccharea]|uniref:thermonuclease family protein n=1 Tax=Neisseria polysaccharea TaxID=489 RepID=UPI0027E00673|nr:thermonuclease family protein [Neisseria polysaccharea]